MKINGFSIKMNSERSYSSSDVSVEKREMLTGPPLSSKGDRVSISRESAARIINESGFSSSSKSVVRRRDAEPALAAKPAIEIMTKALTGKDISITNIFSKSSTERSSSRLNTDQQESIMSITRSFVHKEKETVSVTSSGTIKTNDGMEISFDLLLQMERGLMKEGSEVTIGDSRLLTDPLVINFSGAPPQLSDSIFSFDIDSDGITDKVRGLSKGTGFLAMDRNKDGEINNGTELFGPSSGNGFGELSALDGNADGWIDEDDEAFSDLMIWSHDEETGSKSLMTLSEAGIGAIFTGYTDSEFSLKGKEGQTEGMMRRTGLFVKESGEVQNIFQVDLAKETPEASKTIPSIGTPARQAEGTSEARATYLKEIREKLREMKDNMKKSLAANTDSASPRDELLEKIQKRLEDLMKFFDEKTRELKGSNNKSRNDSNLKLSILA